MARLYMKNIRGDYTFSVGPTFEEIWKWSPTRDIKIKSVSLVTDIPAASNGTFWLWLGRGAVGMPSASLGITEEEQVIAAAHVRVEVASVEGKSLVINWPFAPDYIPIKEGESIYLMGGRNAAMAIGISMTIYYE